MALQRNAQMNYVCLRTNTSSRERFQIYLVMFVFLQIHGPLDPNSSQSKTSPKLLILSLTALLVQLLNFGLFQLVDLLPVKARGAVKLDEG